MGWPGEPDSTRRCGQRSDMWWCVLAGDGALLYIQRTLSSTKNSRMPLIHHGLLHSELRTEKLLATACSQRPPRTRTPYGSSSKLCLLTSSRTQVHPPRTWLEMQSKGSRCTSGQFVSCVSIDSHTGGLRNGAVISIACMPSSKSTH